MKWSTSTPVAACAQVSPRYASGAGELRVGGRAHVACSVVPLLRIYSSSTSTALCVDYLRDFVADWSLWLLIVEVSRGHPLNTR